MKYVFVFVIISTYMCVTPAEAHFSWRTSNRAGEFSEWSSWSSCSVTCGQGIKERYRKCLTKERNCTGSKISTKSCFYIFCPSYLTWPRIHFSGRIIIDVNTVNNDRCAYDNDRFSPVKMTKDHIGLQKIDGTHTYYTETVRNWNPDGTNQVYFQDSFVTSICLSPGQCSTKDAIVGLNVTEAMRGIMTVIDVDWQSCSEIWGLAIKIPGILEGDFIPASHQYQNERTNANVPDVTDLYSMTRYKSKLVNVSWSDNHYRQLFHNAKELSFVFMIDMFNIYSTEGRITGTIGLSSPDDPRQFTASRVLYPQSNILQGSTLFHVDYVRKMMTVDLAYSISSRFDGKFLESDLGALDFALLLTKHTLCKYFNYTICKDNGTSATTLTWLWITSGGEVSQRIGNDNKWYSTYGGIMDISLKHLSNTVLRLLKHSRVALLKKQKDGSYIKLFAEYPHGIAMGLIGRSVRRLDPGDSQQMSVYVSSFGRPAVGLHVSLQKVSNFLSNNDCGIKSCNRSLGVPSDALEIRSQDLASTTNGSGIITFTLHATKDPGTVRGCGLDGQVYPLRIVVKYPSVLRVLTYTDGSSQPVQYADYTITTFLSALKIYNAAPNIECPTWDDVKEIFTQYYNLYPVMWKNGIVDLHSYHNVRQRWKMLKAAMFETSVYDPRYMPSTRDLSSGKKQLIWNWINCGMKKASTETIGEDNRCSPSTAKQRLKAVRSLLQNAIMVELSTIPPYVTAWLSLKTVYGRNQEVARILESIFNEEMLHMTLAANVLNSIGGRVNLTDESFLPVYPSVLSLGNSYQLCPDMEISLGPFSPGLIQDVFLEIEKPSSVDQKQLIHEIGELWKVLPTHENEYLFIMNGNTSTPVSSTDNMEKMLREISSYENDENANQKITSTEDKSYSTKNVLKGRISRAKWLLETWRKIGDYAQGRVTTLKHSQIYTIGGLYTTIAMHLAVLESCSHTKLLQMAIDRDTIDDSMTGTIFNHDITWQLNMSHWYHKAESYDTENLTGKEILFEVHNLKSALEALVEIVYQGEGGSDCSPFVTEKPMFSAYEGSIAKLSHYYRFQEIVHGRKLVPVQNSKRISTWTCLEQGDREHCKETNADISYCYAGNAVTFHEDGVWPVLSNPKENEYTEGTKVHKLNHQFNLIYTRLLYCLQDVFGGQPNNMKKCMSLMYDLTITGKRIVRTPIGTKGDTKHVEIGTTGKNGCPTWQFIRALPYRAGLPVRG